MSPNLSGHIVCPVRPAGEDDLKAQLEEKLCHLEDDDKEAIF